MKARCFVTNAAPKVFISYSWTSEPHEEWVLSLSTELRESGVDVILDKWDLKEGHDANAFMEKMVTDSEIEKVAIICDRMYAEKADGRSGGVGTETQIISAEMYASQNQNKFVAVLSERDENEKPFLPTYYKSRVYIDLSNSDLYVKNFEQLLRWIYNKPLHVKPDLGKTPKFLTGEGAVSLETTSRYRRALEAIRQNKSYCTGAMNEYFETFGQNLERFRIAGGEGDFDEKVVGSIEVFLPYRNEAIELFSALAQYRPTPETWQVLHRFFEKLIPYLDRPEEVRNWQEWDFDNFKFIIHEIFLYAVAILLRYECFAGVAYLLSQHYYVGRNGKLMVPFTVFRNYLRSLEHRNKRLNLRRLSLPADILFQRSKFSGLPFGLIMQADLVLFIRDCLDSLRTQGRQGWWPDTLLYSEGRSGAFEVFARCQSKQYFEKVHAIFEVNSKDDFLPLAEAFRGNKLRIPQWEFDSLDPFVLMGFEKLATLP
jgi:hypothetical protein